MKQSLKLELWKRFGSKRYPAEWDGNIYGGGKLSQRYWEYFKTIDLLNISADSVVLDIGGGSPTTGIGFFAELLATAARKVLIMDPILPLNRTAPANIEFIRKEGSYEEMKALFIDHPEITHISCISVFEHIESTLREEMVRAVNDFFRGQYFIATFEYHAKCSYFEHQLTATTTSSLFAPFTNFYLDEFAASPVLCEDAIDLQRIVRLNPKEPLAALNFAPCNIPRWYPIVVRFIRMPE